MMASPSLLSNSLNLAFAERNRVLEAFFAREAPRLAEVAQEMARRFQAGGRLLAFGRGACATDAQHVSVEFVHPVIVGKRAMPALDVSIAFRPWIEALVKPEDIVMGFGPPEGDTEVTAALRTAESRKAMTLALPGSSGWYCFEAPDLNPFLHQELIETLYHVLWETVHVFLEHQTLGQDSGSASFLYPFLGTSPGTDHLLTEVARSIIAKACDDAKLRTAVVRTQNTAIEAAVQAIRRAMSLDGKLILFGNGGSATDANDWALDCILPPRGLRPMPAISLSLEPANITALANDVGTEVVFLRQLIAHAKPNDIAVGISTSGGSRNIIAALEEARRRGLLTVALLGYNGGEIARRGLADHVIVVSSDYIPRIQEVQASIYHFMVERMAREDSQHA